MDKPIFGSKLLEVYYAVKQGPLSEITFSGIPWVANSSLAAVITLFAVCVVRSLISTDLE